MPTPRCTKAIITITTANTVTSTRKSFINDRRRTGCAGFFYCRSGVDGVKCGMKNIALLLPFIVALRISAAETNDVAPAKIGAVEADKHYDQLMIVTGTVAQVNVRPSIVFINLDKPHPDSPFTCVIFPSATNQFGDLKSFEGKAIEVTGKIKSYHDAPEMVLDHSNQLVVVSAGTNAPAK